MRFWWNDTWFEIEEVLDRWYQGENNPEFPVARYFKVRTADQKVYLLKHKTADDNWYL